MRCSILFLLTFISCLSSAQTRNFKYARSIGGSNVDDFTSLSILRNGNVISTGSSNSTNFDCVGNHNNNGTSDCLIACTNPLGQLLWKKMVGGTQSDATNSAYVDTTTDGNFILGFTTSSNDGDITGNHGLSDIVFQKYTPNGTLLWSKIIGGNLFETLLSLKSTSDGGCIVLATSTSSVNGDITGINHGNRDGWVVKLNSTGNVQWEKLYGGSDNESTFGPSAGDESKGSIILSSDGGYSFSMNTRSVDGDLNNLLPSGAIMGEADIWLVHIDVSGNILWSKLIGGSDTEQQAFIYSYDGKSIYLTTNTLSTDRDMASTPSLGGSDEMIFKYSSDGNLIWKKRYGSSSQDGISKLAAKTGNDLTAASSSQALSFSGFPVTNNGDFKIILYRIDTTDGAIKWLRSVRGSSGSWSFAHDIKISNNGDVFIAGTSSSNGNDINGNHGDHDALVLSFFGGNFFTGTVFIDANNNNILNLGELKPNNLRMITTKNSLFNSSTITKIGVYDLVTDTGTYTVKPDFSNSNYYTSVPSSFTYNFLSQNEVVTKNFAVHAVPNINDLRISIIPLNTALTNGTVNYLLKGCNVGTNIIPTGYISLKKDSRPIFLNFSQIPNVIIGDSAIWNFINLAPFDTFQIRFSILNPPTLHIGNVLTHCAYIRPVINDFYPTDNSIKFNHLIVGSYDPNCKINDKADTMQLSSIQNGEFINYTIQFQNTGTAPAIDISIIDTLPISLQANTLDLITSSAAYTFSQQNNILTWTFKNINLPDSTNNEPLSHGYISFRIKPLTTLNAGDSIVNRAAIYFDFNAPVLTAKNSIKIPILSSLPLRLISFNAQQEYGLNSAFDKVKLTWNTTTEINMELFEIEKSENAVVFTKIGKVFANNTVGNYSYSWNDFSSIANKVFYRLKIIDKDGNYVYSNIQSVSVKNTEFKIINSSEIKNYLFLKHPELKEKISFYVTDMQGKKLLESTLNTNNTITSISIGNLASGVYFLCINNSNYQIIKFIKN